MEVIQTGNAPPAIGPYSQAIRADSWVFVSGQIGLNPDADDCEGDGLPEQARQALENIRQILLAAGCSLSDVVSVDVFLTDMEQFETFNRIYEDFFSGHRPSRAVVEVRKLPRAACVEIKCLAYHHN